MIIFKSSLASFYHINRKFYFLSLVLLILVSKSSIAVEENTNCIINSGHSQLGIEEFLCVNNKMAKKSIFIFMDGTNNNNKIPTSIYRLKTLISNNNDGQTAGFYINGVGNEDHGTFGTVNSRGLEDRMTEAYKFLIKNYRMGDKLYLFGFSRGAFSIRALAGVLSYAGIPDNKLNDEELAPNDIIDLIKDIQDRDYENQWKKWKPGSTPLLSKLIADELGVNVRPVEITFMGIWDTVPGSIALYDEYFDDSVEFPCKEMLDWKKKWPIITKPLWALSFGFMSQGERYKVDSYPPIRNIAHALSNDEKRSMFRPLFVCEPINREETKIKQVVFPGAHADIGGGYEDFNNELPSISLNWMIEQLKEPYKYSRNYQEYKEANPLGLAHLSISDERASTGSKCQDRIFPEGKEIEFDDSLDDRRNAGKVPLYTGITPTLELCNPSYQCNNACEKNKKEEKYSPILEEQKNLNCDYLFKKYL